MKLIKYRVMREVNHGTDAEPQIEQVISGDRWLTLSDKNLEIVKATAYNGEYTIEDILMTAEEARAQRDKLLEDTDWTQVLDAPIDADTREAYRAYRQALRDIPEQEGFPHSITWPELPVKVKAAPDPVDEAVGLLLSGATGKEATE